MAITITPYDHTVLRFVTGENLAADTYKVNLYSAFDFDPADTTKTAAETGATQLSTANGYTQNDKTLASVAITQVSNGAKFDAADVTWTATGGPIAASGAMVYNDTDTDDSPVAYIDFGETKTADEGTDFKLIWDATGIVVFTVPTP